MISCKVWRFLARAGGKGHLGGKKKKLNTELSKGLFICVVWFCNVSWEKWEKSVVVAPKWWSYQCFQLYSYLHSSSKSKATFLPFLWKLQTILRHKEKRNHVLFSFPLLLFCNWTPFDQPCLVSFHPDLCEGMSRQSICQAASTTHLTFV